MQEVIKFLLENGWVEDGKTAEQAVRIPTMEAPAYGGIGGKLTTMGGRRRFALPDTDYRVTVGARTTFIYKKEGKDIRSIAHCETKELDVIKVTSLTVATMSQEGKA